MGRIHKDEGIIIAKRDYSDADRIYVIFTKSIGKASFIAKGVRKPKSRKRGILEIGNLITFTYADSRSLPILTEAELLDNFSGIRTSLKKISVAYFMFESIGRVTQEQEKNLDVYGLLQKSLTYLGGTDSLKLLRHRFVHELLVIQGFWDNNQALYEPDIALEAVIERKLGSIRVGKKLQI